MNASVRFYWRIYIPHLFALYFSSKNFNLYSKLISMYLSLRLKYNGMVFPFFDLLHGNNSIAWPESSIPFLPFRHKIAYRSQLLNCLSSFTRIHLFVFSSSVCPTFPLHLLSIVCWDLIMTTSPFFISFFLFLSLSSPYAL